MTRGMGMGDGQRGLELTGMLYYACPARSLRPVVVVLIILRALSVTGQLHQA